MGCSASSVAAQAYASGEESEGETRHSRHHRHSSALILMSEDNRATADERMKLRARGSKSTVLRTISTGWHKGEHYVVRIAVTGGPSGGKGEAIELITRRLTDNGFNVHPLPSANMLLFNSGFSVPPARPNSEDRLHYE